MAREGDHALMAGRQLKVGEFVRLNALSKDWFVRYLGETNVGQIYEDFGYGRQYRYAIRFLTDKGTFYPIALPRTHLVIARLTEEETLAWLEREITR